MEPVDVYLTYCSIKTHFSRKNYDYHKFNGKTTAKKASFYKRKDRIFFAKIARKYKSKQELVNYMKKWDDKDIIWKDHKILVEKYKNFLTIDLKRCKMKLMKVIQ